MWYYTTNMLYDIQNANIDQTLTWFTFNPTMDRASQAQWSVGWNYLPIIEVWDVCRINFSYNWHAL